MATMREQPTARGRSRTPWLIGGTLLIAIAVAVVLIVLYTGGGSGGGGGGY